jgi:RNA polymerase sigma-70 factor (ECF subfamily)
MRYKSDMDEWGAFYRAHKDKLSSYLMRLTGDYYLSCDIMQESFLRYFKRYRKERNTSLLYKIAKNAFLDSIRKSRKSTQLDDENQAALSSNQEHDFIIREEYRRVIGAMQKLKEDERDMLSLVVGGDLSYREIAELTGQSEANVKVKVHRARVKLKDILQGGEK